MFMWNELNDQPMPLRTKQADTIAGIAFIVLAAAIYFFSIGLPAGSNQTPGAGFFPRLIAAGIGLLAIIQIIYDQTTQEPNTYTLTWQVAKQTAIPFILLMIYIGSMPLFGFFLGTTLFLMALLWSSKIRSFRTILIFSFGISFILQYVFGSILRVPLPDGLLPIVDYLPIMLRMMVVTV